MQTGERVKVIRLERPVPSKEDRSRWEGEEGLLIRRLNVPWTAEEGALWEVRFDSGDVAVFSDRELAAIRRGVSVPNNMAELEDSWGKAPRTASQPFKKFGAGAGAAPAVLALLVFALAGVLLLWASVASGDWRLGAAGGVLLLIGVGAAGVLIT
jgi:hypothetical protein